MWEDKIKMDFKKYITVWNGFVFHRIGRVTDFYEHSVEPYKSIKEIFLASRTYLASQKGLYNM